MTLVTIAKTDPLVANYNLQPFVFAEKTGVYTLAAFWTTTFGAPDESTAETMVVESVVQDSLLPYEELDSLADVRLQNKSYYFDFANQLLYIHVAHECAPWSSLIEQGRSYGFCNKRSVYLDDVYFAPLLISIPGIGQSEDFLNYDKLSFIAGQVVLSNVCGNLDYLMDISIFGNDLKIFTLEDKNGTQDYSFNDLTPIAALYIEDYSFSQKRLSLTVQDKRKANNVKIPSGVFTVADYAHLDDKYANKTIPLAFGTIRSSAAIPVNSNTTGTTTFRQAKVLTSLGTVQVKTGDVWVTKSPTATDLPNGSFTLASADSRSGTQVFECRVLGSVGIAVTTAADVIVYLNLTYGNSAFTASNYNLAEWAEAVASLEPIGILFDKEIELYEAIRIVQNGANIGFRYEIDASGKRTIRIDDPVRAETFTIHNEDIENIDELEFETDRELLAASVIVNYAKDFNSGDFLTSRTAPNYDHVKETYRIIPTMEFETYLDNATDADARAAIEAAKYKDVAKKLTLIGRGREYLTLRIFDVGTIEATMGFVDLDASTITGRRAWLGVWKAKIIAVDPDLDKLTNKITVALISKTF